MFWCRWSGLFLKSSPYLRTMQNSISDCSDLSEILLHTRHRFFCISLGFFPACFDCASCQRIAYSRILCSSGLASLAQILLHSFGMSYWPPYGQKKKDNAGEVLTFSRNPYSYFFFFHHIGRINTHLSLIRQ